MRRKNLFLNIRNIVTLCVGCGVRVCQQFLISNNKQQNKEIILKEIRKHCHTLCAGCGEGSQKGTRPAGSLPARN